MGRSRIGVDEQSVDFAYIARLRQALDRGVVAWQMEGRMLARGLLRASLRYLRAGYRLDDAHLSLILRSALYHQTGIFTALAYQRDSQTVADVTLAAIVDQKRPVPLDVLWHVQRGKDAPADWQARLSEDLRVAIPELGYEARSRAAAALYQLETGLPALGQTTRVEARAATPEAARRSGSRAARWLLPLLAVVAVIGLLLYPRLGFLQADLVQVPEGTYWVADPAGAGGQTAVYVAGFGMMPREATNRQYRDCVEHGHCSIPRSPHSTLRQNYFFDAHYDQYPVVYVTWADAAAYCTWRGMRLPTAREWEVAASYSPVTGMQYRYPWGSLFDPQRVNYAGSEVGDTRAVGTYHPQGDSALGISELAGNVAEWTSSASVGDVVEQAVAAPVERESRMIVKGGSYRDGRDGLLVYAEDPVLMAAAEPWLGFRCAR